MYLMFKLVNLIFAPAGKLVLCALNRLRIQMQFLLHESFPHRHFAEKVRERRKVTQYVKVFDYLMPIKNSTLSQPASRYKVSSEN